MTEQAVTSALDAGVLVGNNGSKRCNNRTELEDILSAFRDGKIPEWQIRFIDEHWGAHQSRAFLTGLTPENLIDLAVEAVSKHRKFIVYEVYPRNGQNIEENSRRQIVTIAGRDLVCEELRLVYAREGETSDIDDCPRSKFGVYASPEGGKPYPLEDHIREWRGGKDGSLFMIWTD